MAYRGEELIFREYSNKNNCCNYVCSVIFFVKIVFKVWVCTKYT